MVSRRFVTGVIGASFIAPTQARAEGGTASVVAPPPTVSLPPAPPPQSESPQIADPSRNPSAAQPLDRQQDDWIKTVHAFHALYGPLPQQREGIRPSEPFTGDDPKVVTYNLALNATAQKFRSNHVETLLNQASSLLDRCADTREVWLDKAARAASFAIDILDFIQNDAIHSDEIAAGLYETPSLVSSFEARASKMRAATFQNSHDQLQHALDFWYDDNSRKVASAATAGLSWLSVVPNYKLQNVGDALQNSFNGSVMDAPQRAVNLSSIIAYRQLGLESWSLSREAISQSNAANAETVSANAAGFQGSLGCG